MVGVEMGQKVTRLEEAILLVMHAAKGKKDKKKQQTSRVPIKEAHRHLSPVELKSPTQQILLYPRCVHRTIYWSPCKDICSFYLVSYSTAIEIILFAILLSHLKK